MGFLDTAPIRVSTYETENLLIVSLLILDIINDINPLVDSNLYRIYCSEFNKDISKHANKAIIPISSRETVLLKRYIYDNLLSRLNTILRDVSYMVDKSMIKSTINIPTVAKIALDDTIMANSSSVASVAIDPITRLKSILFENNRSMLETYNRVPAIADSTNVDNEDISNFSNIIDHQLTSLWAAIRNDNIISADIKPGYQKVIEYLKSFIYLLVFNRNINYSLVDLYTDSIFNMVGMGGDTESLYKYSHMSLASAICVYPGMMLNIKQDKDKCSMLSESFRFLKLATAYDLIKDNITRKMSNGTQG